MTVIRFSLDDPRVLALARERQQVSHEGVLNPTWAELTDKEREGALAPARSYLEAAARAGLLAPVPSAPADQTALRDRIADTLAATDGWRWVSDSDKARSSTYRGYQTRADAVLAVLPATADRTAELSDAERTMLNYALNQAQLRMWSTGKFTDEDQAAVVSLRRRADEAQQPETQAAPDPSWPRRAWNLGLLHKGGDPHHCPACVAQPEPPKDFICPGAEANAEVLANPQPAAGAQQPKEA